MTTRRQFLLATGVLGTPLASLLPFPAAGQGSLRLGLVQVRAPFVDQRDLGGSRARAFTALRVLLQRSLAEQGPLDWLATSALPLSGPLPAGSIGSFALSDDDAEMAWLARFAVEHGLQLELSAWCRDRRCRAALRRLRFEPDGTRSSHPYRAATGPARPGLALDTEFRPGSDTMLAERCRRYAVYGAGIATCQGPKLPPDVPALHVGTTRFVDPGGRVLAQLSPGDEGCLAISL